MSDGLPTEEQLGRIRRGVMRRIDARRRIGRRIAGSAVAVLLIGGGIGLLATTASRSSMSGAASGGSGGSAASVVVRCHSSTTADSTPTVVTADPAGLPRSAIDACAVAVDFQSGASRMPSTARSAPPTASPPASPDYRPALRSGAVVCRGPGGRIEVYPTDRSPAAVCRAMDLRPFRG